MKRKSKNMLLLAIIMVVALIAACSSNNGNVKSDGGNATNSTAETPAPTTEPSKTPEKAVELLAYFPGDKPADFDQVISAVNEKIATDGIAASLNIQFLSWNDYGNITTLKTSAGEEFDMFLDAPWLHINQMISSDAIIPLDDLINQNENLKNSIPKQMWEANKFNGSIYGIPLGISQGKMGGFLIRKDLREKYGLDPIQTLQELEGYLYKVKQNDPSIIPFATDGRYADGLVNLFNFETTGSEIVLDVGMDVYYKGTVDGKIYPVYEQPGFEDTLKRLNKYFADGILERNMAQQENSSALFNQGKVAAIQYSGDGVEGLKFVDALKIDGVELEVAIVNQGQTLYSDFKQWNFLVVPSSSKHADKAMQVMDWLSLKENHDLLEYGIEGKHWEAVNNDQYKVVEGSQYSFPGYVMTWRPNLVRTPEHMIADDLKWYEFTRDADNYELSPFAGFTPDTEAFKTEYAQLSSVKDEILKPLGAGVLAAGTGLKQLQNAYKNSGNDKIIAELETQFKAFLANQ
ncbi:extracellular solute-binding protein [Paenibacillus sp. CMAA1364]